MRTLEATILTTHVDSVGERFDPDALESFVSTFNKNYLPLTLEHDIRRAPIGRIASAAIVPLSDGEFAVKGILEVFEEGDTISSLRGDGRRVLVSDDVIPTFKIEYDRSYETDEGRAFVEALHRLSPESRIGIQVKKSVEPVSALMIAATVAVGVGIANGFLTKLGEDLYLGLKGALKEHFSKHKNGDRLLVFQFTVMGTEPIEVQVVLTNPSADELDILFTTGFADLDSYLARCIRLDSAARFVFEYKDRALSCLYVLTHDGVPVSLHFIRKQ